MVISSASGSRPAPLSAPVSRPDAGSRTMEPRRRSVATLSMVAGWNHISVCIAGANSTGHRAVTAWRSAGRRPGRDGTGEQVRGSGRDDDEVGFLPDADVRHLVDVIPDAGVDGIAGQRLERGGADEAQRGLGRNDTDEWPASAS